MRAVYVALTMCFLWCFSTSFAQTISVIDTYSPANLLNNVLVGGGVTISNITYNGSASAAAVAQPTVGYFTANGSGFPLSNGIVLSNGWVNKAGLAKSQPASDTINSLSGDPDLNILDESKKGTYDLVILELDFVPSGDSTGFTFIFASEEYPEYAPPIASTDSLFNDVFGFFLSGPGISGPFSRDAQNIALLPDSAGVVSVNNINPVTNPNYYDSTQTSTVYDGMTTALVTIMPGKLQCGKTYHLKIALADVRDRQLNSAIFLDGGSFSSTGAGVNIGLAGEEGNAFLGDTLYEGCSSARVQFFNPPKYTDSNYVFNVSVSGTATNGADYTVDDAAINSSYTIPEGQDTLTLTIEVPNDGLEEGEETLIIETFHISGCEDTIKTLDSIFIKGGVRLREEDGLTTVPAQCRQSADQSGHGVVSVAVEGGLSPYAYSWTDIGTGETAGSSTWEDRIAGVYRINVKDTNGCFLTDTIRLDSVSPIAAFEVSSPQFIAEDVYEGTAVVDVVFTNNSQHFAEPFDPPVDTTFFWAMDYPNDAWVAVTADANDFNWSYSEGGEYLACLRAINKNSCADTTCQTIIVYDPLEITPVNVFTPNGDGKNDNFTFAYSAKGIETFQCTFVNRWGVEVFEINDIKSGWNGTNKSGAKLPDGVYYYTYSGVAENGTPFEGQGFTHLLSSP